MVRKSEIACMRKDFGIDPPHNFYDNIPYPAAWSLVRNRLAGKKILDIGACTGWVSFLAQKEGGIVVSTDIFYQRPSGVGLHRVVCDKEMLPFRNQSFDFILTANTLHHGDLERTAQEAKRVLKDAGELVSFEEPCISSELNEKEYMGKYCRNELDLGIDEKRPNMIKYAAALSRFAKVRFYTLPWAIFAVPRAVFSDPSKGAIQDISSCRSYTGGIAIQAGV